MKNLVILLCMWSLVTSTAKSSGMPEYYKQVDQVLWVVSDLENIIAQYEKLGFSQTLDLGVSTVVSKTTGEKTIVKLALANLGGARIVWIQPQEGKSVFSDFHALHGDGAMSMVHRSPGIRELKDETRRLDALGIGTLDDITIKTSQGSLHFVLFDTETGGKYILGLTAGVDGLKLYEGLSDKNRLDLKLNQYAFAISDPAPVSEFWHKIGLPEFQLNNPELFETRYYGKLVDHKLIQGWQRHGSIDYEWCVPVKPPIVYADHILKHGEGIHHLAFTVNDMDKVLDDYRSCGFVVSMGGRWGEKGKPGSGRYEYIDLEDLGGVTMELLWSYQQ